MVIKIPSVFFSRVESIPFWLICVCVFQFSKQFYPLLPFTQHTIRFLRKNRSCSGIQSVSRKIPQQTAHTTSLKPETRVKLSRPRCSLSLCRIYRFYLHTSKKKLFATTHASLSLLHLNSSARRSSLSPAWALQFYRSKRIHVKCLVYSYAELKPGNKKLDENIFLSAFTASTQARCCFTANKQKRRRRREV